MKDLQPIQEVVIIEIIEKRYFLDNLKREREISHTHWATGDHMKFPIHVDFASGQPSSLSSAFLYLLLGLSTGPFAAREWFNRVNILVLG